MPDLRPVERQRSVRDQVAHSIRSAIVDLRLRPDEVLVEHELCEVTTASRATVREALRQLESEGLVVSQPGRGTRVARLTADEARHLYEVRAVLEGMAGRLFAERATDTHLKELAAAVATIESRVDDPAEMLRAKSEFYEVLFTGAGNPELRRMLDGIHHRVTLLRANSLNVKGRPAESLREMKAILRSAKRRDAETTAKLCADHVRAAQEAGLSHLT